MKKKLKENDLVNSVK